MQAFISESAERTEIPVDTMLRGLREELQITLSEAKREELARNMKWVTDFMYSFEIPIGLETDYTIHKNSNHSVSSNPADLISVQIEDGGAIAATGGGSSRNSHPPSEVVEPLDTPLLAAKKDS